MIATLQEFVTSYPDRTTIQLNTHAIVGTRAQSVDSHKASVDRWKDMMNYNGISIKVASKNLHKKNIIHDNSEHRTGMLKQS